MDLDAEAQSRLALALSLTLLLAYEVRHWLSSRRDPLASARTAHAQLRTLWVAALGRSAGSEVLAVQTLRNSVMSATITASTAMLGLMGVITVIWPRFASGQGGDAQGARQAMELLLMLALFASHVASAMAVRYFNQAGFIVSLPTDSAERRSLNDVADFYLRQAGLLYGWGLRLFFYAAPFGVGVIYPWAMPVFMLGLIAVVAMLDKPGVLAGGLGAEAAGRTP